MQKQVALQEQISREQTIRQVAAQALRDQNVESEGLEEKVSGMRTLQPFIWHQTTVKSQANEKMSWSF